jgi:hypothetical protein
MSTRGRDFDHINITATSSDLAVFNVILGINGSKTVGNGLSKDYRFSSAAVVKMFARNPSPFRLPLLPAVHEYDDRYDANFGYNRLLDFESTTSISAVRIQQCHSCWPS